MSREEKELTEYREPHREVGYLKGEVFQDWSRETEERKVKKWGPFRVST